MIKVESLKKQYGAFQALKGISFTAKPGEILGILGPNGAGKTTTMRILTGFMPPSDGKVTVAGYDVTTHSLEVRKRVGYLPERVPLYPDMTVEGFIAFWAKLREVKDAQAQTKRVLERVNLYDRRKSLVRKLSKGMRQRLGLAQALVHNPEVVILDEPTIGIDPQQVIEVRDSVRALGKDHTVLFSTHILSEAEQVCDRVIILNRGELVAEGEPGKLRQKLDAGNHLYVQIAGGTPKEVAALLQPIKGVLSVTLQSDGGYAVRAKNDVRAQIYERVAGAGKGYTLLEMRPVAMTLEDIFLEVVKKS
jgi:ABC-2 type transport system ATP-binding protein